jgi:hypothetical protein
MEIAKILDHVLFPPVLYRDASSYERLVETWEDTRPIPTLSVIQAAENEVAVRSQALNSIAAIENTIPARWVRDAALGDAFAIGKLQEVEVLLNIERAKL